MDMKPTRDVFGEELVALGKENERIVVLSGDLEDATRAEFFKHAYPQRFFNILYFCLTRRKHDGILMMGWI